MQLCPKTLVSGTILALLSLGAAAEHPRLLVTPADRARLRHACGLELPPGTPPPGRAGMSAGDYAALREALAAADGNLPGELSGAALLRFVQGPGPGTEALLRIVEAGLRSASSADKLEAVLALDWCWDEVEPAVRQDFLLRMRRAVVPLAAGDSPLEPRPFREKLTSLAVAIAVDESDDPSPSWLEARKRLLEEARRYFLSTFPTYVAWRGLSPTGSDAGADEERDTALAIELAGHVLGRDLWPEYRASVGRWLEHYVLAEVEHPALARGFLHDDGAAAPANPAANWDALRPLTAHLLAVRTRDPAAVRTAERVEQALRQRGEEAAARQAWRWVPIVLPIADLPRCDPQALPAARHLGGAVIFRGGRGPEATRIWIDAGQPFLRRGQHFDAGHFVIERGGQLTAAGGDDVHLAAVPTQRGAQRLGRRGEPFDFEQYCTATIAHNALLMWDPLQVAEWYGARYLPAGGQRCIEQTCTDFVTPLEAQGRRTGATLAYGQQGGAAYLALDLAPAYHSSQFAEYTREFVFVLERALLVVDRVTLGKRRGMPTWIVNLPARPQVDGQDPSDTARVWGATNVGGVWRCNDARWLRWGDRDGALWLAPVRPLPRTLRVVGGPANRLGIEHGRYAGRSYFGGDADGFERLILPAEAQNPPNAWYRLGEPLLLGPEIGRTPHWGRVEIEPAARNPVAVFINLLVADRADHRSAPELMVREEDDRLELSLALEGERVSVRLPQRGRGGAVTWDGPEAVVWTLPDAVVEDGPLAPG